MFNFATKLWLCDKTLHFLTQFWTFRHNFGLFDTILDFSTKVWLCDKILDFAIKILDFAIKWWALRPNVGLGDNILDFVTKQQRDIATMK